MVEWSITPDCKSGGFGLRGFESLPAHKRENSHKGVFLLGQEEVNCFTSERDEKGGVMFREYAKPRAGVAEIYERRRINYL